MNKLVEQVSKIRSEFSHKWGKISIKEILTFGPLDYLYEDRKRDLVQSIIIERIFANLELPPLYMRRELLDIDVFRGDELIIPILRFYDDKLKLEGLDLLTELEGFTYSKLPTELQDKFLSHNLDTMEFHPDIELDHIGYLGVHYNE